MSMKNVELLMGNHEEFFLEGLKEELEGRAGYVSKELWLQHGGDTTYQQFQALEKEEKQEIIDYLKHRPLYKILGNIVLVHGGIQTENMSYHSWEELMKQQKRETLLWTKNEFLSKPMEVSLEGMVIFGHTPTVEIRRIRGEKRTKGVIWKEKNRWGIDGGYLFGGRINCICLDNWQEFYIEKIRHNTLIKGYEYIVKSERKKAMDSIENAWNKYDESQVEKIMEYNEGYKNYISVCKTERECVRETIRQAEEKGYRDLKKVIEGKGILKAGDKVYYNNMDKALALFVVGEQPLEKGMKILGAHIDSPRIDLKQNPLYEDTEQVLLDTHYYGGIKKYQWVALPLALHGVVVKKDGTKVEIVIGEEEGDPVVGISDLLVHLSREQMEKKASKVIEGEDLNILIGSIPLKDEKKDAVKANIKKLLKEKYDIEEEDFISAEIEAVPAGRARDFGIDKSMVMGYGHDDRVCAYTSYTAMFEIENPDRTCVCLLVDKEEIGSTGATGMESKFFENAVAELMDRLGDYSELKLRRALQNSQMLSSDVSAAFDPNYPSVNEKKNAAYFGKGITFNKFTGSRGKSGSNDANPEYIARLRAAMEKHNVSFQTAELGKVDVGGGGTIAKFMASYNMEVIDCGVPVLNMHAPWEIASKIDIYETMLGYIAFLKEL